MSSKQNHRNELFLFKTLLSPNIRIWCVLKVKWPVLKSACNLDLNLNACLSILLWMIHLCICFTFFDLVIFYQNISRLDGKNINIIISLWRCMLDFSNHLVRSFSPKPYFIFCFLIIHYTVYITIWKKISVSLFQQLCLVHQWSSAGMTYFCEFF